MDELLGQFLIEGRDLIAQAAADLETLAADATSRAAIDSAFRAVHTLKGSVGLFPMAPAERVLHAAEDVLEQARKDAAALDPATVAALVGCLDAIDRWVDDMEHAGALSADAESIALARISRLPNARGDGAEITGAVAPAWAAALAMREQAAINAADGPLVAFRYSPDPDCFFRGDDPLAVVAAVPDLVALSVLPADGGWPALDAVEPFRCVSILEGLSAAPADVVRGAFRLVSDQVQFHVVEPRGADAAEPSADSSGAEILRVEASRVDALADRLGELIVAANALAPLADEAERIDRALGARLRAAQGEIEGRLDGMRLAIGRVRLVPLAATLRRLPRLVREIADDLGKPVAFSMTGETLEIDKRIADALFEPLLHLLRNAVDHGIEDAATRAAAGKDTQGHISLAARRDGDAILLTLSDDGAGIDADRLRAAAVSRGLLAAEAAAQLDDDAARRLIFRPGFSTARQVTGVSGRGVGMDAVQASVDRLRGTIGIDSGVGQGTTFRLRLPANALTTRLLVVRVGEDRYGVSLDQVVETVRIDAGALMPVGEGTACVLRGKTVPVLSLARLLGAAETPSGNAKLLVTRAAGGRVALRVDGFAERLDTVVRPPSGMLTGLPGISGSALMGDGGVLLVLDLPELAA